MNASTNVPTSVTRKLLAAVACGVALLLPSCQLPKLCQAEPGANLPATFNGTTNPDNSAQLRVEEFFNDPTLIDLIRQALAGNQDLKILAQDIRIANNLAQARRGALFPFVTLGVDAGLDKSSRYTRNGAVDEQLDILPGRRIPKPLPDYMVAANFTWQIDIWRKLRNARDAATLRYLATAEGRNYVVTRLVADVADNYFGLLALDKRLQTLDAIIAIQQQSLEKARALQVAGRVTELPVQRFQAEVQKNQSELLIVRQDIIETENRINFLLGRFPQPVPRAATDFFDLNLRTLAVGVPSQLLQNRPDIRQAERELGAAGLEVKVARAEFYPSLIINGAVGYEAFNPRYLFNPEAFLANVAGGLVAPLVNRTAVATVFSSANARQLQAIYNYQRVVLSAFTEVVNRVAMEQNYRNSITIKRQQIGSLETAVDIATKVFQSGRSEYIDVLFSQRDLLDARTALIDTKRQQLSAIVNAYQALGGGGVDVLSGEPPDWNADGPVLLRPPGGPAVPGPANGAVPPVPALPPVPPGGQPLPVPREEKKGP